MRREKVKVNPPTCHHMSVNNGYVYFISFSPATFGDLKDIFWSRSSSCIQIAWEHKFIAQFSLISYISLSKSIFKPAAYTTNLNDVVLFTINMQYKTNIFLHFFTLHLFLRKAKYIRENDIIIISWLSSSNFSLFVGVNLKKAKDWKWSLLRYARAKEVSRYGKKTRILRQEACAWGFECKIEFKI